MDDFKLTPDARNVLAFAGLMREKMEANVAKFGNDWRDLEKCPTDRLQRMLVECIIKGDPVDVANLAMMLHQRGETAAGQPGEVLYMVSVGESLDSWRFISYEDYCNVREATNRKTRIVYAVKGQ